MKTSRTLFAVFSLSLGLILAGCGSNSGVSSDTGSGGTSGGGTTGGSGATQPNSILSGKYAFSFVGTTTQVGNPIFIAGSFTADGAGNISAGEEDLNIIPAFSLGQLVKAQAFTGTYTIGTDGRGTLTLSNSQTFKIAIEGAVSGSAASHGQLIRFDTGAAGSGTFDLQTSTAESGLHQGSYVFNWNGSDPANSGGPFSAIGNVNLAGTSANGAVDVNDDGSFGQGTASMTLSASDTNGHGTANVVISSGTNSTTLSYGYVIVSANRILLIETDSVFGAVGEADAQSSGTLAPSGAYALYLNSLGQEYGLVGQIVAGTNSSGTIPITSSEAVQDTQFSVSPAGTYPGTFTAADSIAGVTVNDRFTLSATEPTGTVTDMFVVYMVSANQAMIMEEDADHLTFGQMLSQTGAPFSSSSLTGNYGFNFSGLDSSGSAFEADLIGQFLSAGNATLSSGTVDINYEGNATPTIPNNAISGGSYVVVNNTTGHGTLTFTADGATFSFNYYFVSPSQIFLLETDTHFVGVGSAQTQPTIP